jgi:phenylacetate-CoA ligase
MMIIRGVNVFPSQIEHALLGVDGLEPHYQILLGTRPDHQTGLRVRVETSSPDPALEDRAGEAFRNALDLSVAVELVPPHTIPRSEGKAVRVVDEREETS